MLLEDLVDVCDNSNSLRQSQNIQPSIRSTMKSSENTKRLLQAVCPNLMQKYVCCWHFAAVHPHECHEEEQLLHPCLQVMVQHAGNKLRTFAAVEVQRQVRELRCLDQLLLQAERGVQEQRVQEKAPSLQEPNI